MTVNSDDTTLQEPVGRSNVPSAETGPVPWWQVVLAVLPGVMIIVDTNLDGFGWQVRLPAPAVLMVLGLFAVSSCVWAVARRRPLDLGRWGLVPLGLFASMGASAVTGALTSRARPLGAIFVLALECGLLLAILFALFQRRAFHQLLSVIGAVVIPLLAVLLTYWLVDWTRWGGIEIRIPGQPVVWRMDWSGLDLYVALFLLVVVAAGLAKHQGRTAGLFVLSGGAFLVGWHIEQAVFFWDRPLLIAWLELGTTTLFYVVAPIWVLCARSALSQTAGLLVPVIAYVVLLVLALGAGRGFSVGKSIAVATPAIVLCAALGAAIVLYSWVRRLGSGKTPFTLER